MQLLKLLSLVAISTSSLTAAALDLNPLVSLASRCADGTIPLNSLSHRCEEGTEQLHWMGRKCDNDTYKCPSFYDCSSRGLCCITSMPSRIDSSGQLCLIDPKDTSIVHVKDECTVNSDCAKYRSDWHRCCDGKCVIYAPLCHYRLIDFLRLRSTGTHTGQYIPLCNAEGGFQRVQMDSRLGTRWCVDEKTGLADTSGCCLPDAKTSVCPASAADRILSCPADMCSMEVCVGHPEAVCRVNPCGPACTVEFFSSVTGQRVDCYEGLGQCGRRRQEFYSELARLHRRDQTQWQQAQHFRVANSNESLLYHLENCTRSVCVHYDADSLEWPNATATEIGGCQLPIDSGQCPSTGCHRMCKRWGYDWGRRSCRMFWFAGAGGDSRNRFTSWSQCMWALQHCHRRVLIALPTLPACRGDLEAFHQRQWSDNGFYWCADGDGRPTEGSLHAADILCRSNGSLLRDWYYEENERMYKAECPGGRQPQWCHNVGVDHGCQSPGIFTFADACDACRLVHVNVDGEEVACHSATEICTGSAAACKSVTPRFTFSEASSRCRLAPLGQHSCTTSGHVANYNSFSREDYCLHACSPRWCPNRTPDLAGQVFPDLCVAPSCDVPESVCIADDCNGMERYLLPDTGEELMHCRRKLEPFDLAAVAACGVETTAAPSTSTPTTPTTTTTTTTTTTATTTTTTTITTAATTTAATTSSASRGKTISSLCRRRSERSHTCTEGGQYRQVQCNRTVCWCVVTDTGERLRGWKEEPASEESKMLDKCPMVQTLALNMTVSFQGNFAELFGNKEHVEQFEQVAAEQLAAEALLQPQHVMGVTASAGSVLLLLQFSKNSSDSVDLPAAAFELETMANDGSLKLRFKGSTLAASKEQNFCISTTNSQQRPQQQQQKQQQGQQNGGGAGGIAAVIIVLIVLLLAAAAGVIFYHRRRGSSLNTAHQLEDCDTASSAGWSPAYPSVEVGQVNMAYAQHRQESPYDNPTVTEPPASS